MRFLLSLIVTVFLFCFPVFGQSEKPQTIIVPTGSLGDISETRIKILEKTFESKLDDYFDIVPKQLFEEALEKAFEELDYEECTEDQCIMMIQEMLQVENAFQLVLIYEEGDTQISVTWNDLDKKRVEEEYCEGCRTKELRKTIAGLIEKLVGVKEEVVDKSEVIQTSKVVPSIVQEPVVQNIDNYNNSYVIVGRNGTILNSHNGIDWEEIISNTNLNFTDVIYGNEFVSIGNKGIVMVSKDSYKWEKLNIGERHWLYGITFQNNHYYTVGNNGFIAKSTNGIDWEFIDSGVNDELWDITFGNGVFVIVGRNGVILVSKNGDDWEKINLEHKVVLHGVTYGKGIFVSVGENGVILLSSDGRIWTKQVTQSFAKYTDIIYANNKFITVSDAIYTSKFGRIWTRRKNANGFLTGITYGNDLFVVTDLNGSALSSKNGILWKDVITGSKNHLEKITNSFINTGVLFWRRIGFGDWQWYLDQGDPSDNMGLTYLGKYEGLIKNNLPHGKGNYSMLDGRFYEGEFKNGKEDGYGNYIFKNGDKYVGEWNRGNRTGKGKLTWVDGSVVEGDFKDNLPWDCIHFGINQEEIGKWINGEFVPLE